LIFDKTGKTLIARNDYCLLEAPEILQEINGGFSAVIAKDYTPILIDNYMTAGNAKVESFANVYREAIAGVSIIRFDNEANVVKKNSYLLHEDTKIKKDKILDVINDSKYNYVLLISNMSGTVNEPTLAALIVQRDRPSVFEIENLYEDNVIYGIEGSFFKKQGGKVYAHLPKPDKEIEIKAHPKQSVSTKTIEKPINKSTELLLSGREKGDQILAANEIKFQCITYDETPNGIFIGTRLEDNTPMNYLYDKNKLSLVPNLDSYTIFGYNSRYNALVVGFYNKNIRIADTMSRDFSIYKLESSRLVKQVKYNVEVYNVQLSTDQDSLVLYPNLKNTNGIGSTPKRVAMKIKTE
jgi:hypothetical protein